MDEQPAGGAPPVVAVVVTRDPGPWLEETLAALDSQDYPSLSILVIDAKLVFWDRTGQLLSVGMAVDKLATPARLVERGELDQEQHDAVRDVFAVTSACMLVRADLFASVGGFSAVLGNAGEDIDLC